MFKELMFKLPDYNGRILGEPAEDLTQEPLRFAIHPAKDRPMIAMATANYGDLKIMVCLFFVAFASFVFVFLLLLLLLLLFLAVRGKMW